MMLNRIMLLTIILLVMASTAFCSDDNTLVTENNYFFASQKPFTLADAGNDEWGTSPQSGSLNARPEGMKSPGRAILYSLLLPGLGEVYVGDSRTRATIFFSAEVGIWSTVLFSRRLGSWKKDDYKQFAIANAGVDPTGKDDMFWDMVGFHNSRDEYNKISRVYTRDNPFYPETPEWDWQWMSDDLRQEYRDIKNDSKTYYRAANFALAGAALNRVVSMFFAWRSAKGHNRSLVDEFSGINFRVVPLPNSSTEYRVEYNHSF
jgi:hypothetical protein